jgi:hypothetical protein
VLDGALAAAHEAHDALIVDAGAGLDGVDDGGSADAAGRVTGAGGWPDTPLAARLAVRASSTRLAGVPSGATSRKLAADVESWRAPCTCSASVVAGSAMAPKPASRPYEENDHALAGPADPLRACQRAMADATVGRTAGCSSSNSHVESVS